MKKLEPVAQSIIMHPAVWVPDSVDDNLAKIADFVIETGIRAVSVPDRCVEKMWAWFENRRIKIFNRYDLSNYKDLSVFSGNVTSGFRRGASGSQIFVDMQNLEVLADGIAPIRDDLFFDKDFVIAIDIEKINNDDWGRFFGLIKKIRPDAILFTAHGDKFDSKSDFVGRLSSMMGAWDTDAELQIMFGKNNLRIIQTIRLAGIKLPKLANKITVFTLD